MKIFSFLLLIFPFIFFSCNTHSVPKGMQRTDQQHYADDKFSEAFLWKDQGKDILVFHEYLKGTGDSILRTSYYPANELLVKMKKGKTLNDLNQFKDLIKKETGNEFTVFDSLTKRDLYAIRFNGDDLVDLKGLKTWFSDTTIFLYSEPNYLYFNQSNQFGCPVDITQWGLQNKAVIINSVTGAYDADADGIEAISRFKYGRETKTTVLVGVIDGGANIYHPALTASLFVNEKEIAGNGKDDDGNGYKDDIHGWNFASNNMSLVDNKGHGTHVTGIITANPTSVSWVTGAFPGVKVLICKTTEDTSHSNMALVKALNYAAEMKCDVINMSLGSYSFNQSLADEVKATIAKNIVVVAASGNDGKDIFQYRVYPATLPNVISVSASNHKDELAYFSNYHAAEAHLAAPGEAIYSTIPGGYGWKNGTSMAAPLVTATAAMIRSLYPNEKVLSVRQRLYGGADRIPQLVNKVLMGNRLNIYKSIFQPLETFDANGTPYSQQVVNGRMRESLTPYANSGDPGIDGKSFETAYTIANIKQLMNIRDEDLNAHFRIMNNLDWHGLHPNYREPFQKTFNGVIYGQGYSIVNFDYQSAYPAGLFLRLGRNASISNLKLSGVDLKGRENVGALASVMEGGIINNVQVEGKITGNENVGGIIGNCMGGQILNSYFEGVIEVGRYGGGIAGTNRAQLSRCHVQARINALQWAGGIAGNTSGSLLEECFANVQLAGTQNSEGLAGLVGNCVNSDIRNCYSEGNIKSSKTGAGLIGHIRRTAVVNCYSLCEVSLTPGSGGLLGDGLEFNIQKSYFAHGNLSGIGGIAKSQSEMKMKETFAGWWGPGVNWTMINNFSPGLALIPRSLTSSY
ncbi:S8 family serine peptidase [Pseudobacter ginsenosidimutans]|uniref:Subtilase family protein n=1 Tax=Pseudobacter ginsenosidimutans TaxID=661488 RepID=A0A4Q7N4M1_9BACT|nr:S8 family serine peptidase [Pseudobacter ginsenosidimutans]RZS75963.1 subtilase family protein [Pseudobacter ginsenosidimutans]